ncbi:type I-B CRISPR-associated protein Cas7/Cst2/DevR [Methanobacterium sp. MBAC-LM]|uniref:type I-B CRISPR-associated protein Cas7/Cst2/DevR n=1 Tax=Methanobacterium sp. MBAC-LM TaxID=3412034 RepID=UPI003C74AE4B
MDIVFYGNSLNYDQGSGNYQELKKITKWDGRQYTLVSRYALRYSLLETAKKMGLWETAKWNKLNATGEGDVIQPAIDFLFSGELLNYPEFDLFGYLITKPQNFRTAPVKINHAVSMTPFNYDALFNANLGLANRMMKRFGKMSPNPFTAEEHETFYQYSVVVDVDNVGEMEVYFKKGSKFDFEGEKDWTLNDIANEDKLRITIKKSRKTKEIIQTAEIEKLEFNELNKDLYLTRYGLKKDSNNDPVKERVIELLKAILNLKRSIKGREEDLAPKLIVMGVYRNNSYKTYKDKISLLDEYVEEEYDEIEETPMENGGRVVKVRHKTTKSRKPLFEIEGIEVNTEPIGEKKVLDFIEPLFESADKSEKYEAIKVFKDVSVKVKNDKQEQ